MRERTGVGGVVNAGVELDVVYGAETIRGAAPPPRVQAGRHSPARSKFLLPVLSCLILIRATGHWQHWQGAPKKKKTKNDVPGTYLPIFF
jgi:hypothetical protein